jgi:4-amino-4-deoxy-L-arabinose transferase-like glycosyltransferase
MVGLDCWKSDAPGGPTVEIKIDSILGLPAHPLFAHGPVVLVPLTAIAAVVCALSRGWRQRLGWLVVGLAFVTVVSVALAIGSGEAFEESVRESELVEDHAGTSDSLLPLTAGLFVAVVALVAVDRAFSRGSEDGNPGSSASRRWVIAGLAAATIVTASVSTVWIYRSGHSGAKAVWDDPDQPMLDGDGD